MMMDRCIYILMMNGLFNYGGIRKNINSMWKELNIIGNQNVRDLMLQNYMTVMDNKHTATANAYRVVQV